MAFELLPATEADIPELVDLSIICFADDPIIGHLTAKSHMGIRREVDIGRYQKDFSRLEINGFHYFKVVEKETGKIVAFARWQYPYTLTAEQEKEKEAQDSRKEPQPEGANVALCDEFFGKLLAGRKKWVKNETTYFLQLLVTHPSYQRKGLGAMLIRVGLEAADAAGAETFIEASMKGFPLYLRHGWVHVDETVVDMRPHGGSGLERHTLMMRPSQLKAEGE